MYYTPSGNNKKVKKSCTGSWLYYTERVMAKKPRKNEPMRNPENTVVAITCKKETVEAFDRIIEAQDLTRSQVVRRLMKGYVEAYTAGKKHMDI